jgi:hypothetical protein
LFGRFKGIFIRLLSASSLNINDTKREVLITLLHVAAAVSAIYQSSYASTLPDNIANPITIITPIPLKIKLIRSIGSIILNPSFH